MLSARYTYTQTEVAEKEHERTHSRPRSRGEKKNWDKKEKKKKRQTDRQTRELRNRLVSVFGGWLKEKTEKERKRLVVLG